MKKKKKKKVENYSFLQRAFFFFSFQDMLFASVTFLELLSLATWCVFSSAAVAAVVAASAQLLLQLLLQLPLLKVSL